MKRVRQSVPPGFVMLSRLLLAYLSLPLASLFFRLSPDSFRDLLHPKVVAAAGVSVITATATTLLLLMFGVPLSYILARRDFPGKTLVTLLVQLPLALPPSVSGILLLMAFGPYAPVGGWLSKLGLPPLTDNLLAIVAAQVFVASPFLIIAARTAFEDVDPGLEQVAATFGKSPGETFRRITLALASPAIRSGITLAFVRALGEFGATAMVAYHPYSLPVLAWVQFSESGLNSTVPLVMLMLALGAVGVAFSHLLARRRQFVRNLPFQSVVDLSSAPTSACVPAPELCSEQIDFIPATHGQTAAGPIIADIVHDFGGFRLDVHFETACRRVAVLGPSGAGKSLLLKILAGLVQPSQGRVTLGRRTLFDACGGVWLHPDQRRIGYVPQHFALFPHMTVWQNILFPTTAQAADIGRAAQALRLLGLETLSEYYPNQLSFGQQQRAALARALVRQPDYLLLDEPFASLDTPFRLHLRRELLRILRQFDVSVVLVTHDPQEAYELVEEVIVIAEGRVLQQGRREDVFGTPASALVAKLLGFRNTFRGRVMSSTPKANVIKYRTFFLSAPPGPLVPGTTVDFFVSPYAVTAFRPSDSELLPPGTVLSGVIDAAWPHPAGDRLAVIVGDGACPDYWEVEEIHDGPPPERWNERDPVRLLLPQASIQIMNQDNRSDGGQVTKHLQRKRSAGNLRNA
jgi:ABC-type sulfate/molybdate transport systems ATPase subunit/ABC-type sulfate transport system permease component